MNQKTVIAIIAVLIIIIGGIYYFRNNYHISPPENVQNTISQESNQILIKNFAFSPAILNVAVGTTVTWTNNDSAPHRISGGSFQSGDLTNGQSYSFKFSNAGTYDYICGIHTYMKGTIIVK